MVKYEARGCSSKPVAVPSTPTNMVKVFYIFQGVLSSAKEKHIKRQIMLHIQSGLKTYPEKTRGTLLGSIWC